MRKSFQGVFLAILAHAYTITPPGWFNGQEPHSRRSEWSPEGKGYSQVTIKDDELAFQVFNPR